MQASAVAARRPYSPGTEELASASEEADRLPKAARRARHTFARLDVSPLARQYSQALLRRSLAAVHHEHFVPA